LCKDFKKILLNSRQELVLVRSNTDNNALIFDDVDATTRSAKVLIHQIAWRVPHISVAIKEQLKLLDVVKSARELYIPFKSRELHEYPMLSQTQRPVLYYVNLEQLYLKDMLAFVVYLK
jgi:hypothetical protein